MPSRLIITFLCAAAIGSVSGAFLIFKPAQFVLEDIETPTGFSASLNSKPTEEVTVYFQHPFMAMSKCMIVFNPNDWNVPQEITAIPAPLFLGSPDSPETPSRIDSELLARAVTAGPLPPELSFTDVLKITQASTHLYHCSMINGQGNTFDSLVFHPQQT
ncbi:hypothetical protein BASA50_008910 [Batrachochytrium salamandrivorans]|uniref:Copper type II ascorbate-dependent monooxygenase C-terminal domain-containing protein n=1 Tax=Batrachochytrium salamandrivorans TaxID=1357716 RepID=A0ABQ8F2R6_9FUNG|nr:hypothetical protein BASA50_008910 [Batrachochytrium salamandrivorans]KAH6599016.1 hypothetical protein BASA61_002720 [Batrachochytrium salamandrivorans]